MLFVSEQWMGCCPLETISESLPLFIRSWGEIWKASTFLPKPQPLGRLHFTCSVSALQLRVGWQGLGNSRKNNQQNRSKNISKHKILGMEMPGPFGKIWCVQWVWSVHQTVVVISGMVGYPRVGSTRVLSRYYTSTSPRYWHHTLGIPRGTDDTWHNHNTRSQIQACLQW